MNIKIISIGNKPNKWELEGEEYYIKQLPKNLNVNYLHIKGQQHPNMSKKEILQKESDLIFSKISKKDYVVSWDAQGKDINSEDFSIFLSKCIESKKEIIFIIGGSLGLSDNVLNRSNLILSASLLTFPHRLFRLILMEQIYRAYTIINKKPYHK
jgi:23S rRNA (pseudouridine1915-N3)-methyltransferase